MPSLLAESVMDYFRMYSSSTSSHFFLLTLITTIVVDKMLPCIDAFTFSVPHPHCSLPVRLTHTLVGSMTCSPVDHTAVPNLAHLLTISSLRACVCQLWRLVISASIVSNVKEETLLVWMMETVQYSAIKISVLDAG